jgi:adenosylmethionine-8-amino-7-oxononanoate aminotransferase
MVWPNVGHVDGDNGDLVVIAPPFIITQDEVHEIVDRFKAALNKTLEACHV